MSDLRESGSIEQDADIVAFLYRDDYYNKPKEKTNVSLTELIIANIVMVVLVPLNLYSKVIWVILEIC